MPQALTFPTNPASSQDVLDLHLQPFPVPSHLEPHQILVQTLTAPINPLDLEVIKGIYPFPPQHSLNNEAIAGFDAAFRVLTTGATVPQTIHPGSIVIPRRRGLGTWRTHAVLDATSDVLVLPPDTDATQAALLRMGVAPAFFLLEAHAHLLRPGDWILLNAAGGVIPQFVTQLARLRGVRSISVIRDRATREGTEALKRSLRSHGADLVLAESELALENADTSALLAGKRITLALDAVFGSAVAEKMAARLSAKATFVTYGFLGGFGAGAKSAFALTDQLVFFKGVTFKGFRLSEAFEAWTLDQQRDLLTWFCDLFAAGTLKMPELELVEWDESGSKDGRGTGGGDEKLLKRLRDAVNRSESRALGERKKMFVFR